MNTLLAILKVNGSSRHVILAGGMNHRFSLETPPPPWFYQLINLFPVAFPLESAKEERSRRG